ncbi:hypothetical protein DPEC_G00235550 [Dallia pectoralis]|uniref:Uncharacterized protein n=1 Tax=Dallia pectoralis TaxID=75939 RepID=A0ACC2FXY5_DALPE|nr:hypothetical protein DPEC_G00235550 [Dallia pectoralis]
MRQTSWCSDPHTACINGDCGQPWAASQHNRRILRLEFLVLLADTVRWRVHELQKNSGAPFRPVSPNGTDDHRCPRPSSLSASEVSSGETGSVGAGAFGLGEEASAGQERERISAARCLRSGDKIPGFSHCDRPAHPPKHHPSVVQRDAHAALAPGRTVDHVDLI